MITRVLINGRGRQKRENQRDGSVTETQPTIAGFEDGGRGQELKNAGGF